MMMTLQRIIAVRTGGGVERCHGIRHHGSYTVAQHTWGVLALLYELWPGDFDRLALRVMFHDVPEAWIGDIPASTKKYSKQVKEACDKLEHQIFEYLNLPSDVDGLSPEDIAKIKACDHLELYLWAKEQIFGGNLHACCIVRELERFFSQTPLPARAMRLFHEISGAGASVEHATDGLIFELSKKE